MKVTKRAEVLFSESWRFVTPSQAQQQKKK
jgi:hypothetical protein